MTVFVYSIDLAEKLNYCAIHVTRVHKTIQIADIRKFKDISYPNIRELLLSMFQKMSPTVICTDYTSEKSFSEELEAHLNPSFLIYPAPGYKKWKYVKPCVLSSEFKMTMKQNAMSVLQNGWFEEPSTFSSTEKLVLWKETKDQLLREITEPKLGGGFRVPKPVGQNNDLAMSFEMNLMYAKEYLTQYGSAQVPLVVTFDYVQDSPLASQTDSNKLRNMLQDSMSTRTNTVTGRTVRLKLPGQNEFS